VSDSKPIMLAKRDGTLEPFLPGKLRRVLDLALRAGRHDPRLADPLIQAVEAHLCCWDEPRPPTTEYVYRCVHTVLRETGLDEVADVLATHRRSRRLKRRSLRVLRPDASGVAAPWRKTTVVEALEKRFELGHAVARIVAGELETRVLNLGYRTISSGLLEELMRNELLAWGLAGTEASGSCTSQPERRA
jgi:hypothetical protein